MTSWQRYTDDYGQRIGLKFPYDEAAKNALRNVLDFPQLKWDGEKKMWSVVDDSAVIQIATDTLAQYGYTFDGLDAPVEDYTAPVMKNGISVVLKQPDKLVMRWPYRENYQSINAAVKSCGNAKFNMDKKTWTIPLTAGLTVAEAVESHYGDLADAIRAVPEVGGAVQHAAERVLLSSAVDADPIWMYGLKEMEEVRPYQWVAPNMFVTGGQNRLLLADDMGLGKSLQALLCVLSGQFERTLVVCPAVVKHNWAKEIEKWTEMTSVVVDGRSGEFESVPFTIINYDILHDRVEELHGFDCVILDECHALKNPKAKRTKAAKRICREPAVKGIIAMSGTPILNRPIEMFSVLNLLKPATFNSEFTYAKQYCAAIHNGYGWDFNGASNIELSEDGVTLPLNHLLKDVMLRRSMDDDRLSEQMPDMIQNIIEVNLSGARRQKYDGIYNSLMDELEFYRTTGSGGLPPGFLLNILTRLRHASGLAKTEKAIEWARHYHQNTGKPLVIFAHHKDVIHELTEHLSAEVREGKARAILGDTPDTRRQTLIDQFQAGQLDYLVCSTLAMKEGVNLDRADTTLFVERQWVPAHERQAAARVRRLTQESEICQQVIISAADTVDTHFDKVVSEKQAIVDATLDGTMPDKEALAELVAQSLLSGKGAIV